MESMKLIVNTFIPDQTAGGIYAGDNRMFAGTLNQAANGSARTQQHISIVKNPGGDPPYNVTVLDQVGTTHRTNPITAQTTSETAASSGLTSSYAIDPKTGEITVNLKCSSANPLFPGAPPIDYNLKMKIRELPDGSATVGVTGIHDGFPAYEIYGSMDRQNAGKVVYRHDPGDMSQTPASLLGTGEFKVDTMVRIQPAHARGRVGEHVNEDASRSLAAESLAHPMVGGAHRVLGEAGVLHADSDGVAFAASISAAAAQQGLARIDAVARSIDGVGLVVSQVNPGNREDVQRAYVNIDQALSVPLEESMSRIGASSLAANNPQEDTARQQRGPVMA